MRSETWGIRCYMVCEGFMEGMLTRGGVKNLCRPPSRLGPPMCPHHVQIFLDGVIRPAPPQDFSPSSTIHTHAPPTILCQWHHYIHHARHPPPHAHPFAFFDLRATRELRNPCIHLPKCIYHFTMH
ncbi:hypothetical protein PILCRDRAFT_128566 [Piloderma croceum F 1598]|uniref:Uncharacterized protein n=1 Tax=Piloderma croceum (strain F 1598) TaxID=765440 RepID=A0A0C3BXX2_PILCF|nr:hypothetical protein PILCRDRAFT_128555 [Piloderma croceum F 1598]KIM91408.1 hypothetical protein PILCRDRAFT_128566 [Piloderma croceum F 1598]